MVNKREIKETTLASGLGNETNTVIKYIIDEHCHLSQPGRQRVRKKKEKRKIRKKIKKNAQPWRADWRLKQIKMKHIKLKNEHCQHYR